MNWSLTVAEGITTLKFEASGQRFEHEVYVARCTDGALLGTAVRWP